MLHGTPHGTRTDLWWSTVDTALVSNPKCVIDAERSVILQASYGEQSNFASVLLFVSINGNVLVEANVESSCCGARKFS